MLDRFVKLKQYMDVVRIDNQKVDERLKHLKPATIELLNRAVKLLHPFKAATDLVSFKKLEFFKVLNNLQVSDDGESISVVLVAVTRLKAMLQQCDGAGLKEFKKALLNNVSARFDRCFTERLALITLFLLLFCNFSHYLLATILDARFKDRAFSDKQDTYQMAVRWLKRETSASELGETLDRSARQSTHFRAATSTGSQYSQRCVFAFLL